VAPTAAGVSGGGGGITSNLYPNWGGHDDAYGFMDITLHKHYIRLETISHAGVTRRVVWIKPRPVNVWDYYNHDLEPDWLKNEEKAKAQEKVEAVDAQARNMTLRTYQAMRGKEKWEADKEKKQDEKKKKDETWSKEWKKAGKEGIPNWKKAQWIGQDEQKTKEEALDKLANKTGLSVKEYEKEKKEAEEAEAKEKALVEKSKEMNKAAEKYIQKTAPATELVALSNLAHESTTPATETEKNDPRTGS
jgi:hypothetical protein